MPQQESLLNRELEALLKRFHKIKLEYPLESGFDCGDWEESSCSYPYIKLNGKVYQRNSDSFDSREVCNDCDILNKKGNYHHFGCEIEECPRCGKQLLSCDCIFQGFLKTEINSEKAPHYPLTDHLGYISIIDTNQIDY